MVPAEFRLELTKEQIARRVKELGREITAWSGGGNADEPVALPILNGAIFFFADLVREISTSVEVMPMRAVSYLIERNSQAAQIEFDLAHLEIKQRRVLLIDDICDSGRTLQTVAGALIERGAREVKSAVLIRRLLDTGAFTPDWSGFEIRKPDWFVGYGMDSQGSWRNLPDLYCMARA